MLITKFSTVTINVNYYDYFVDMTAGPTQQLQPILPTKSRVINSRIDTFNSYIFNDLVQSNLRVILVQGFKQFADYQTGLLRIDLADSTVDHDILHINLLMPKHPEFVRSLACNVGQTGVITVLNSLPYWTPILMR